MQNKKTIFFLINSMENGGAERVISNILPSLSQKFNIYLILLKDSQFYDLPKNIKIIFFSKTKNNPLMVPLFPFYIWKLKKIIKKYHPIKIISFLEIANFVNILTNKKAIISFRTSFTYFNKLGFIGKLYKLSIKILYPKANKIIVNSEENKVVLTKLLQLPQERITVIYNSVNISEIKRLKKEKVSLPFIKKDFHKIFITIGRLDKQKNVPALIKTFKNLSPENILLIIGDGSERKKLANLIKEYSLQKQVFLLGRQKNVYKYLNIANYFIFSSKVEGFPNVLIEAMTCHLPIITSDFKTGARELIDPDLDFNKKLRYPYYGPNGALLSLNNFTQDFQKINWNKLQQKKAGLEKFKLEKIIKQWENTIN